MNADVEQPVYLTTREVADLLRVKERKVYDLAGANEIPHRRITGKLLFPRAEILAWIEGSEGGPARERPAVLTGSHDPLLDWAVRYSGSGLATLFNGSLDGLKAFAEGRAAAAGLHVPEDAGWNIGTVGQAGLSGCVLIGFAARTRGLVLSASAAPAVRSFGDLRGRRVVLRQAGAGAARLFERQLAGAGMTAADIVAVPVVARSESDAAGMIAEGVADAAPGLEAMARSHGLGFLPLVQENFDLLVDRRSYFTDPFQTLLAFLVTAEFRDKAASMGGYDLSALGSVRWLSP